MVPYPQIRKFLIDIARKEKVVHYQDLCDGVGLNLKMAESPADRAEIGRILGEISAYEHQHCRPLISSVVVSKGGFEQGDGFYKLSEELGFGNWKKLKADGIFEVEMMSKTHAFWKVPVNYSKYYNG